MDVETDLGKLAKELKPYIFDVCGVPSQDKKELFISHEHLDQIPYTRSLIESFPNIRHIHVSAEVFRVLNRKPRPYTYVPATYKALFKDQLMLYETFMVYPEGVSLKVNNLIIIRVEHKATEPQFVSRVSFVMLDQSFLLSLMKPQAIFLEIMENL
jgi:hypothetical protein